MRICGSNIFPSVFECSILNFNWNPVLEFSENRSKLGVEPLKDENKEIIIQNGNFVDCHCNAMAFWSCLCDFKRVFDLSLFEWVFILNCYSFGIPRHKNICRKFL